MPVFALLSDLHVASGPRWDEGRRVHRWCVDQLRDRRPDGILIGGDFHHARTDPEERVEGSDILLELADIAEVLGIYGNHDIPHDLALYNRLRGRHPITFYERPDVHQLAGVAFALLPWDRDPPAPELLTMTGAARRGAEAALRRQKLLDLGARLAASPATARLVLAHVLLREAKIAMGQPEKRGRDFELDLDELGLLGADGYLLGHVHRSQDWQIGAAPVVYAGSTIRRTFGEIERKYVLFVHVEGTAVSIEWVETPATPMLLIDASWTEGDEGRWGWSVDVSGAVAEARGADIRFTYTVDVPHRAAADLAATELKARLDAAGALMVHVEEKLLPSTRARAPEIAETPDLEAKLAIALTQKGHGPATPEHVRVLNLFRELRA